MNLKTQIVNRTKALSTLDKCYNKDIDCLKGSGLPAESDKHYMKKAEICKNLLNDNHSFVTEAKFKNNLGRADVYDITDNIIYEVVKSEKEESLWKKSLKYPVDLKVVYCED